MDEETSKAEALLATNVWWLTPVACIHILTVSMLSRVAIQRPSGLKAAAFNRFVSSRTEAVELLSEDLLIAESCS